MKKFKKISEWLATKPSEEEQQKIVNLINKGETSRARRELYMKEGYLRKLNKSISYLVAVGYPTPEDISQTIEKVRVEIINLKKEIPQVPRQIRKEINSVPEKEPLSQEEVSLLSD